MRASQGLKTIGVIFLLLGVSACATEPATSPASGVAKTAEPPHAEKVAYIRDMLAEQAKVTRVAHRVMAAASDLCGAATIRSSGAFFADWSGTNPPDVDAWSEAAGLDLREPGIEVLIAPAESPAGRAGLRRGDRILTIDGWAVPENSNAYSAFSNHLQQRLRTSAEPLTLKISRDGKVRSLRMTPERRCSYPVALSPDLQRNAFTDGESIVVMRGMSEFTRNDLDLAVVVSHELSHVLLDHVDTAMENARAGAMTGMVLGTALDVLLAATTGVYGHIGQNLGGNIGANVGALAYSKEHEAEADYYGAYIVAMAGYDYEAIPEFVRYAGAQEEWKSGYNVTHPTFAEREAALQATVTEISEKRKAGVPLRPDL